MPSIIPTTIHNRYPGLKPFSVSENFMFFGRESDLDALNSLIYIKQTVVLYGKSGYGKSSLINAGIIPKLKANNQWAYFSIRFNNYSEKDRGQNVTPLQTTQQRLSEQIEKQPHSVLDELIAGENSFWYFIKKNQLQNGNSKYIFFFDQFEELFTYPQDQIEEFSAKLSDLLYTTIPLNFRNRISDADAEGLLSDDAYSFLHEKPEVKVVFSVREDRLSLLNKLTDKHPSILQNCYPLDALNAKDAEKAIVEPARLPMEIGFKTPVFDFTEAAITLILKSIANQQDGKIEAATLQIVCRYIEDSLVTNKGLKLIDAADLGDITDIFQQYYESTLQKLPEGEREKAQRLIEDDLIDADRRNPLSETYIHRKFGLTDSLLSTLEQSSLLRKERDAAGRILYEVSHDTLVAAINKVAVIRRKRDDDARNAELKHAVLIERQRADEHQKLSKRFKVVAVIAGTLLIVSLVITWYAIKQTLYARHQTQKANQATAGAKQETQKANQATAKLWMEWGDQLMQGIDKDDIHAVRQAKQDYENALDLLTDQKEIPLYNTIKQKLKKCG